MSTCLRGLAVATSLVLGAAAAHAQTPAQRAGTLNDEGRALMFADPPNYEAASVKFRQAIVLSPEGRFYFNLCMAEYSTGDFGNALMACQAVDANGADDKLKQKADALTDKVKDQMRKQGMNPDAVANNGGGSGSGAGSGTPDGGGSGSGTPDGGNGSGSGSGTPDGGNGGSGAGSGSNGGTGGSGTPPPNTNQFHGAPPPSLFAVVPPSHDYTYTLGAALIAGGANIGDAGGYASTVGGFRILGDLLFSPASKVGGEGYVDVLTIGEGTTVGQTGGLTIVDFGVGLYKHFCKGRLCITPMGGVHLVGYRPSNSQSGTDYASIGFRPQISAGYAFGPRYEHYITANLGVDVDLQPLGTYSEDPMTYALTRGGSMVMLSIGYQYRFNTPFGQSPFFQLE